MSTITSDPLFVRAEVAYRLETWGSTPHVSVAQGPDLVGRLRRRISARRSATAARGRHAVLVHRPHRP